MLAVRCTALVAGATKEYSRSPLSGRLSFDNIYVHVWSELINNNSNLESRRGDETESLGIRVRLWYGTILLFLEQIIAPPWRQISARIHPPLALLGLQKTKQSHHCRFSHLHKQNFLLKICKVLLDAAVISKFLCEQCSMRYWSSAKHINSWKRISERCFFTSLEFICKQSSLPKQTLTALAELRYGRQNLA